MIGQTAFHYEVRPGDSADKVLDRLAYQVNEAALDGSVSEIAATVQDGVLKITALDGVARQVAVGTRNASDPTDDLFSSVESPRARRRSSRHCPARWSAATRSA